MVEPNLPRFMQKQKYNDDEDIDQVFPRIFQSNYTTARNIKMI